MKSAFVFLMLSHLCLHSLTIDCLHLPAFGFMWMKYYCVMWWVFLVQNKLVGFTQWILVYFVHFLFLNVILLYVAAHPTTDGHLDSSWYGLVLNMASWVSLSVSHSVILKHVSTLQCMTSLLTYKMCTSTVLLGNTSVSHLDIAACEASWCSCRVLWGFRVCRNIW